MMAPPSFGSLLVGWAFVFLVFGAAVALILEAVWSLWRSLRGPR